MGKDWYGWAGSILHIDLTDGTIERKLLLRERVMQFVGGRGMNMRMLFDELKPGTDPLSPENPLILGTGPLTGTLVGSRMQASCKSPMTGLLGDSNSGGQWGAELKFAGYDHVLIRGKAEKPVYIFIDDDDVQIRDASWLWGKNVWEVTDRIREREDDPTIQVLSIGLSVENRVRFAAIINTFARANGRCGVGAVMGSKNLKCIAVRGTKGVSIADPGVFLETIHDISERPPQARCTSITPFTGPPS